MFNSVYCFKIKFRHLVASIWEYFTLGETRLTLYKWVFSCFDLFKWLQWIQNWTIVDTDSPYYSLPHNKLVGNSKVSRVLYMSHRGVWPTCSLSARTCSITLDHKATRPSSLSTVSGLLAKKTEVQIRPNSSWFITYYSCQLGLSMKAGRQGS